MYNQHTTHYGEYPPMKITKDELRRVVVRQFTEGCTSFTFSSFTRYNVLSYLEKHEIGLEIPPNTTYQGGLNLSDCSRIREIIWDLIIERYLTIGSYGDDSWPNFSITERGHAYFAEANKK